MILLAWVQGFFFLALGLWPIFHIHSFEFVTGPKVDKWLVKTVGLLIAVIGATLLLQPLQNIGISSEVKFLGATSALAFFVIDVVYVLKKTISPVYLFDAAAEALFFIAWLIT